MPQMVVAMATKKLMKSMLVEEGGEDGEGPLNPLFTFFCVAVVWQIKSGRAFFVLLASQLVRLTTRLSLRNCICKFWLERIILNSRVR